MVSKEREKTHLLIAFFYQVLLVRYCNRTCWLFSLKLLFYMEKEGSSIFYQHIVRKSIVMTFFYLVFFYLPNELSLLCSYIAFDLLDPQTHLLVDCNVYTGENFPTISQSIAFQEQNKNTKLSRTTKVSVKKLEVEKIW